MKALYARPYAYDVGSVHKYAEMFSRALTSAGHTMVDTTAPNEAAFARVIEQEAPDLVIVGGDHWPHWKAARRAGVRYIVCEHDVSTLRGQRGTQERAKLENAAAVLFTSEDHRAYCAEHYRLPASAVVHLRPLAHALDFEPLPKLPERTLVYAGGLNPWRRRTDSYGYRCYHRVFEAFIASGWEVHLYPCYLAGAAVIAEYARLGCTVHEQVCQDELPRECSQFTAGLQAYADEGCDPQAFAYTQTCRPNKTWEYLAAGIPTIGYQAGRCASLYDGRWGVVVESLDELAGLTLPTITESMRRSQVIDSDIDVFTSLVEVAMTTPKPDPATRPLGKEVRLAKTVRYQGATYTAGSKILTALARRMYAAGVLSDPRLAPPVPPVDIAEVLEKRGVEKR